jgi:hypothetical protein
MAKTNTAEKPKIHEWTNGGSEVLVLRFSDKNGRSYNEFQHPLTVGESVEAPDWRPDSNCGGGIHGWPWGIGLGDGKEPEWAALWQVYSVKPEDLIGEIGSGPKCKFRTGVLIYSGDWHGAMNTILSGQMAWAFEISEGAASNSGDYGAASNSGTRGAASNSGYQGAASNSGDYGAASNSGDYGAASNSGYQGAASNSGDYGAASNSGDYGAASNSGDYGAASNSGYQGAASNSGDYGAASNSGDYGAASNSGYQGAASNSGDYGAASNSGDYGAASNSGDYGAASTTAQGTAAICTGLSSRAMAAEYGCIALAWWNEKEQRTEMKVR